MRIANERDAREWLASWDGRPRLGVLKAAIDGLEIVAAICREYGHTSELYEVRDALRILRDVYRRRLDEPKYVRPKAWPFVVDY